MSEKNAGFYRRGEEGQHIESAAQNVYEGRRGKLIGCAAKMWRRTLRGDGEGNWVSLFT